MPRNVELRVDNREHKVIEELCGRVIAHTVTTLDIGDFAFVDKDDGSLLVILERKTYADLAASVKDSRYREQKARLAICGAMKVGYIIEECSKGKKSMAGIPAATIESILLGLSVRDGYALINSDSVYKTAELLGKLLRKLPEYLAERTTESQLREHQDAIIGISTVKRENMTAEVCYLSQLAQIPGVSAVIARTVADAFPNMRRLLCALEGSGVSAIQDLKLAGNGRRIGAVLGARIVEYMIGCPNPPMKPHSDAPMKVKVAIRPRTLYVPAEPVMLSLPHDARDADDN
jgi:ERCC4-type nuclease